MFTDGGVGLGLGYEPLQLEVVGTIHKHNYRNPHHQRRSTLQRMHQSQSPALHTVGILVELGIQKCDLPPFAFDREPRQRGVTPSAVTLLCALHAVFHILPALQSLLFQRYKLASNHRWHHPGATCYAPQMQAKIAILDSTGSRLCNQET